MTNPEPTQGCPCRELIKQAGDGDAYIIGPSRWHVSPKFRFYYTRISKVSKQTKDTPEVITLSQPGGQIITIIKKEPQDAEPQHVKLVAPKDSSPKKKSKKKRRH